MKSYILIYYWSKLALCTIQNSEFDENPRSSNDVDRLKKDSGAINSKSKVFTDFSIDKILEKQSSFEEMNESFESSQNLVIDEDYDSNPCSPKIPIFNQNEENTATISIEQNESQDEIIEEDAPLDLSINSKIPINMESSETVLDLSTKNLKRNNDNENPAHSASSEPKRFKYFQNIQESSLLDSKEVISVDLYKYCLELVARILYYQEDLDRFITCFSLATFTGKNSQHDLISEERLVPLVNKLLEFNENANNLVDFEGEKHKISYLKESLKRLERTQTNYLEEREAALNDLEKSKISKRLESVDLKLSYFRKKIEEENNKPSFYSISEHMKIVTNQWKYCQINTHLMCIIFNPVNKIVNFYNNNLRNTVHKDLIRLDLSFIPKNRKFIDYTKYEDHPYYLAYLMVDLFFSIFSTSEQGNYGLYLSKISSLNLLHYLNVIFFLSLNKPDTIQSILNDNLSLNRFTNSMKMGFDRTDLEVIRTLYKNFRAIRIHYKENEKRMFATTPDFHSIITEIEQKLNPCLKLFYYIPYSILKFALRK